jgi:hypothetical protein
MPTLTMTAQITALRERELRALRREKCWLLLALHALTGGSFPPPPVGHDGRSAGPRSKSPIRRGENFGAARIINPKS